MHVEAKFTNWPSPINITESCECKTANHYSEQESKTHQPDVNLWLTVKVELSNQVVQGLRIRPVYFTKILLSTVSFFQRRILSPESPIRAALSQLAFKVRLFLQKSKGHEEETGTHVVKCVHNA